LLQGSGQPLVSRLLETGEDEGNRFYTIPLVDGETLDQYITRQNQIPRKLAVLVALRSLEAAYDLLQLGELIPARPLKGARILPSESGVLEVRMTDFLLDVRNPAKPQKPAAQRAAFAKQLAVVSEFCGLTVNKKQTTPESVNALELASQLSALMSACTPGAQAALEEALNQWRKAEILTADLLVGAYAPQLFLANYLPSNEQVTRAVRHQVRFRDEASQFGQPYALRGLLLKSNQSVIVEPLAPLALTGPSAAESLRDVQNLPKTGKFPNLVPVLFVEDQSGVRCIAEAAVEGVSLRELLDTRKTLDVQETYLVLAGVDVALSQLEKAKLGIRQLRLDDIFLFTGANHENPRDAGLLSQKLDEWPGFSMVLRIHGSLHAKGGRGFDPSCLLPVQITTKDGVETFWHGGWMAALGSFLCGKIQRGPEKLETGIAETDTVYRLLDDEIHRTSRGEASSRAAFLARFARVMQQFHLAQFTQSGGFWTELSGSTSAQDRAAEVSQSVAKPATPAKSTPFKENPKPGQAVIKKLSRPVVAAALAARNVPEEPVDESSGSVGFAEILMSSNPSTAHGPEDDSADMHPLFGRGDDDDYRVESSWVNLREEKPFLLRLFMMLAGAMVVGGVLAHLSGNAIWQTPTPEKSLREPAPILEPPKAELVFDIPVAPEPAPVPKPDSPGSTNTNKPSTTTSPKPAISVPPPTVESMQTPAPPRAEAVLPTPAPAEDALSKRLRELREANGRLTPELKRQAENAAEQGNSEAMLAMGRGWLNGDFGAADEKLATAWFEKAVSAGSGDAMTALADCYMYGRGVDKSELRAVQLLQSAVDKNVPRAKDALGVCYARGKGIGQNHQKAFELFQQAYEDGVPSARNNLGVLYLHGQGVAPDASKAVNLFKEGAQLGHSESMLSLAQCLEYGNGTPANLEQATQWYRSAASAGNAEAVRWCREKRVAY